MRHEGKSSHVGLGSLALTLIGAGSGGMSPARAEALMLEALRPLPGELRVVLVRFRQGRR